MTKKVQRAVGSQKASITFRDQFQQKEEFSKGVGWCMDHKKGSKACVKAHKCKFVSRTSLERCLKVTKTKNEKYIKYWFLDQRRILTLDEELGLETFLDESGELDQGLGRNDLKVKVLEILELRRANNRRGGRICAPLSPIANLSQDSRKLSRELIEDFYKTYTNLKEMVPRDEDSARYILRANTVCVLGSHLLALWTQMGSSPTGAVFSTLMSVQTSWILP